jgi:hypothetical protein
MRRFSEGVLVPQAVWREVVETGKGQPAQGRQAERRDSFDVLRPALSVAEVTSRGMKKAETRDFVREKVVNYEDW